jgi:lipoprotein-releasing system permease protein
MIDTYTTSFTDYWNALTLIGRCTIIGSLVGLVTATVVLLCLAMVHRHTVTTVFFLALRYLKPKGTVISWCIPLLSIMGPMVGVAVLIVVIAVMSGFSKDYREAIFGLQAHLELMMPDESPIPESAGYVDKLHELGYRATPVMQGPALMQTRRELEPKLIRGIDPETEQYVSKLKQSIKRGKYEIEGNEVLIGEFLARRYFLHVGDKIIVHPTGALKEWIDFDENNEMVVKDPGELYSPEELVVAGIFALGMYEYDSEIIVTHIIKANDIFRVEWGDATSINVWTDDPDKAWEVRRDLGENGGFAGLAAITWMEANADFFRALTVEKNLQFFVLAFIVIVSSFSIAATIITIVMQKTREIGVLKALGATPFAILSVFVLQGVVVGFLGVSLGTVVGLLVVNYRAALQGLIERLTDTPIFPPELYHIPVLPAHISTWDVVRIDAVSFLICVLGALLPAVYAATLQPAQALQHDS